MCLAAGNGDHRACDIDADRPIERVRERERQAADAAAEVQAGAAADAYIETIERAHEFVYVRAT